MRRAASAALLLLATGTVSADVAVRVTEGKVDVQATAAPLSEVLDRLARQTGMKIVYEGPAPRPLVTLALERATQVEAVLGILEGLGLNYALQLDPTGTRVQTLVLAGAATPAASFRPAAPAATTRMVPPPASAPDAPDNVPEIEEPDEDEAPPQQPPQLNPPVAPAGTPTPAPTAAPGPAPGVPGGMPGVFGPGYPTQPFTPGPTYSPFGTRTPAPIATPPGAVPAPSPSPPS